MRLLLAALLTLLAGIAEAQEAGKPLVELGLAAGGGWLPDYPASSQNHLKGIAAPYLIYRGRVLRSDEQGVRGRFYQGPLVELDVSLGGALPTSSDDNRARRGMPDLDLMGEIGPDLRVKLARQPGVSRLDLDLPVRGVFTTDFSGIDYRGLVFAPELAWRRLGLLFQGSQLRLGIGPIFGSDGFMDYFYDVEPRYARHGRPEYEARAGYLGTRLQGSFRVPITGALSVVAGGRVDGFWGASNDDSPLFKDELNLSLFTGFSWSFYQSAARSRTVDDPLD